MSTGGLHLVKHIHRKSMNKSSRFKEMENIQSKCDSEWLPASSNDFTVCRSRKISADDHQAQVSIRRLHVNRHMSAYLFCTVSKHFTS